MSIFLKFLRVGLNLESHVPRKCCQSDGKVTKTWPRCSRLRNAVGMSWEIEDFLSAEPADALPADATDVLSAGAAENLSGDTLGLYVHATAEE